MRCKATIIKQVPNMIKRMELLYQDLLDFLKTLSIQ